MTLPLFVYLTLTSVVYLILRSIYRLTLHPLASFPGPKLAAITRAYEVYFEVVKGGRFSDEIKRMHDTYGPIVRYNPSELHIIDPSFYDQIYNFNHDIDRPPMTFSNLQNSPSFKQHRIRRKAYGSYFSKAAVLQLEEVIISNVRLLCDRFAEVVIAAKPIDLGLYIRSLTSEIILEYSLAQRYGFLADPIKAESYFKGQNSLFKALYPYRESTIIFTIMNAMTKLPDFMLKNNPILAFSKELERRLAMLRTGNDASVRTLSSKHRVLYEDRPNFALPLEDKTEVAQLQSAQMLVGAGFETTAYTLETCFFHLCDQWTLLDRLRREVEDAFPDVDTEMDLTKLEKLPFLNAVVEESLRMSLGVITRLPRINTHEDMTYTESKTGLEWKIPKGWAVGMSIRFMHYNDEVFVDPKRFEPERWLQGEKSVLLRRHLVPFSRGARVCLGKE